MIALWNCHVGTRVLADLLGRVLLEHIDQRVQLREFRLGHTRRGEPGGHAFDRGPDGDHLDHLALRLAHHDQPAAWHRADEAFLLQHRQRLAHRRAAHPKVLRELAFVQPDLQRMAVDVHLGDRALDRLAGLLAQPDAVALMGSAAVSCNRSLRGWHPDVLHSWYATN